MTFTRWQRFLIFIAQRTPCCAARYVRKNRTWMIEYCEGCGQKFNHKW